MRNTWWDVEAYDRLCHKQVDTRQVRGTWLGGSLFGQSWVSTGRPVLHVGDPHLVGRIGIAQELQKLSLKDRDLKESPLEPNLGIFAFSTQPLPQHVYTLYFSISRILPKSRGHIYRFLQLVLAPCPPDRPDPAPPSLVGHPAGQRLGARVA